MFDTNCLGDLSIKNKCYITDVSLCELLKEKSQNDKYDQCLKIVSFLQKNKGEFCFMPENEKRFGQFDMAKTDKSRFYNLNKIAENTFVRLGTIYFNTILIIALIIIFKKNKTEIVGDNLLIKNRVDNDTFLMSRAIKEFYEKNIYPNRRHLLLPFYKMKQEKTMDDLGVHTLNVLFDSYNKHVSDNNLKNMIHISKINQNELLKEYVGKVDETFIRKIMESHFDFAVPGDKTYEIMIPYLLRVFTISGKFEFNDVGDYINVFAAKSLNCKLVTRERWILNNFPETAIKPMF